MARPSSFGLSSNPEVTEQKKLWCTISLREQGTRVHTIGPERGAYTTPCIPCPHELISEDFYPHYFGSLTWSLYSATDPPLIARYEEVFGCPQLISARIWVLIPPPNYLSTSPLESMRSGGATVPPQLRSIISNTCAIPHENKQNGCDTSSAILGSKRYSTLWGCSSHWAANLKF